MQIQKQPTLYVAKDCEGTLCSVLNANTRCAKGVLEFMKGLPERKIVLAKLHPR